MKKALVPLTILFVLLLTAIIGLSFYRVVSNPPKDSPIGQYEFEVAEGDVLSSVADKLYEDKVIASPYALRLASVSQVVEPLQTGQYVLDVPAKPDAILKQINEQSIEKREINMNAGKVATKKVTIREGLTLDQVADLLSDQGVVNKEEFLDLANSPEVFRDKYPFLPDPLDCSYGDLSTCAKYYLEGYLYPDTYTFVVGGSTQDVIEAMLKNFNTKVYARLTDNYSKKDLYKLLILSSVIERETGRTKGVTEANAEELRQERRLMADVFLNRIEKGMKWQTDPSVAYGLTDTPGVCQGTFDLKGCVYLDDPRVDTLYNTYRITGYPIGPITSPQWAVIEAVLNPQPNDYLYFVSDVTGKKYFAKTEDEHYQNIEFVTDLNEKISR